MTMRPVTHLVGLLVLCLATAAATASSERIAVLVRPDVSPLAADFTDEVLPRIRELGDQLGIPVEVVDVTAGAPAEITTTPAIVFQHTRGRHVYQGRYTTIPRLEAFLRTARMMPPGAAVDTRQDMACWTNGRATFVAPIKVTPLTGDVASGFDQDGYAQSVATSLIAALERFDRRAEVTLAITDRTFYMDVYPHRSGDRLYLSLALFSQFNCHEPVFRTREPVTGAWADRDEVVREAAARLETALLRELGRTRHGDGVDAIAGDVPTVGWADLGLALPDADPSVTRPGADQVAPVDIPTAWRYDAGSGDGPPVVFRFPTPLQGYAGIAPDMTAHLTIDADAAGRFEVQASTITMGDPDLDDTIRGPLALTVAKHPTSTFTLTDLEMDGPLAFGRQTTATMTGTFEMRGIVQDLSVRTTLEPVIGADGDPRLVLHADWTIRLRELYDIKGPDGPSPQNDTVLFTCHVEMIAER